MPGPALPYVDSHALRIPAPADQVWRALTSYVEGSLVHAAHGPMATLLGTEPRGGFEVVDSVPEQRLETRGRHRFSTYRLTFELSPTDGGTELRAVTHAAFPGVQGWVYRALVIGSRAHVVATRGLLRSVARRV